PHIHTPPPLFIRSPVPNVEGKGLFILTPLPRFNFDYLRPRLRICRRALALYSSAINSVAARAISRPSRYTGTSTCIFPPSEAEKSGRGRFENAAFISLIQRNSLACCARVNTISPPSRRAFAADSPSTIPPRSNVWAKSVPL